MSDPSLNKANQEKTPSKLASHLTSFTLAEIPQLNDLQSLLSTLSNRKPIINRRQFTLDAQAFHHNQIPSTNPTSLSEPFLHQLPQDSRSSTTLSETNIGSNTSTHSTFLPPQIIRVKRENSVGEGQSQTPPLPASEPTSSPDPQKFGKRSRSGVVKKKRKRNGSEAMLSGSEQSELTPERGEGGSPEVMLRQANHKLRRLESPLALPAGSPPPPNFMLSISNAECAEPPLPKIPPPPLPRSDPPPLPSTECPPLPSTAPPPLPTLPMHLAISVLSTALEPCQPDLKPPPPLPERSRDLLIDATSPHILTPPRTLRSPSPPIPPPSPLPPLPKVDLSVPPPLSAVVSSPENAQIPDSTRLVPPASNPPPELPISHVDDSSQTFTHHTSLPSLDRPELDRESLADVPSSLHGLVPVNVPRPSSPVSMLTPPSKVKEKDFAEPRRPKPRLKFGLNAPSYLSTQPTQPHTASFTFPSSNGSTPYPIPAIKPFPSLSRANTPSADHTDEFSIPSKLLTPLPPALAVLSAYPKSQGEVNQDFSKAKAPTNQVPIHQFQNWVNENYLRSFGEDDLAFLASDFSALKGSPVVQKSSLNDLDGDDVVGERVGVVEDETESVFRIPALGPHYSETWRAEDLGLPAAQVKAGSGLNAVEGQIFPSVHPLAYPPLVQVKVEDVTDASLLTEKIEIGPLAERLISMIQPIGPHIRAEKETKKTDEPDEPRAGSMLGSDAPGSVALSSAEIVPRSEKPVKLDSLELEQRIIKELRYIGVLGNEEEVDWSLRADDEISMALRSTQKALRQQVAINTRRKARLSGIVKARMAFQEYETVKEGLDRVIEQGWNKRIRTDAKKKPASKRKLNKNQKNANGEDDDQEQPEVQSGVAQVRVPYSETLLAALEKRQVLIDNVSSIFQEGQGWGSVGGREFGRHLCMGIPTSTIYDDETEA